MKSAYKLLKSRRPLLGGALAVVAIFAIWPDESPASATRFAIACACVGSMATLLGVAERTAAKTQRASEKMADESYELTQRVAQLEQRQDRLTRANDLLGQSNEALKQFAHVAAHDLKEPLRKVASFCQILDEDYRDQLDDDGRQYLHFAVDGATRMQQLITDLLEYSCIGSTVLPTESVSADQALANARRGLAAVIEHADAQISCEALPEVTGEIRELELLFRYLLDNAIQYCENDPPQIRIAVQPIDNDHWLFSIADNGLGIDAEFHEPVFDLFRRLHARSEYPGAGIGLATCRRVVERHGGRIWVESKGAEGSTFKFTLPKCRAETTRRASDASSDALEPARC